MTASIQTNSFPIVTEHSHAATAANRAIHYLTNHVISHVPSFLIRHLWYRRVLGLELGTGSDVFMGCYIWFQGLRGMRRQGIRIGSRSRINRRCTLDARGSISIGDDVSISPEVFILTSGHDYDDPDFDQVYGPVSIADHVWVGTRATVLPGYR